MEPLLIMFKANAAPNPDVEHTNHSKSDSGGNELSVKELKASN